MDKLKLHCPKGNSPTCPDCGNSNAMLDVRASCHFRGEGGDVDFVGLLVCRDCLFAVTLDSVQLTSN